MSEDSSAGAPQDREPPLAGVVTRLGPRVRRLVAPNPSAFTFTGTCSYIIGEGEVAILDPGPDRDAHFDALIEATRGERISHIVVTHTHRDHTPLSRRLKALTGAQIVGARPHVFTEGPQQGLDASHDRDYAPDLVMKEGDTLSVGGLTLSAIETPGHASNHLVFACPEESALFSGDHVMAWSTSVVAPPDGSMTDYMASLEKLRGRDEAVYWPGHGGPVADPQRYLRALIGHRRQREAAILGRLDAGVATLDGIVASVYAGLDPRLVGAARLSALAHLEDMTRRGLVIEDGAGYRRA
jgi:glyoxylase-like metal-dependent hydrolase (beta-lactamase superfamily II)